MIKENWTQAAEERLQRFLPLLAGLNPHPDLVTLLGVAISLGGAWAFSQGHFAWGAVWVAVGGICDLFDGVIARYQGRVSTFGGLLDSAGDRVVDIALLLGLAFYYGTSGETIWVVAADLALLGSVLVAYIKARGELDVPGLGIGLLERGERIGLLVAGGRLGLMPLALCAVALGSWFTVFQRIMLARAKMGALDRARQSEADGGDDWDGGLDE